MKKILALIGIFILTISCSTDSDEPNIHYEVLPVVSVVMPAQFYVNTENEIVVTYFNPSNCHTFDGFYYEKDAFTRTVAIQTSVLERDNCAPVTDQLVEKTLNFKPTETGTYLFKFWNGKDTNGDNVFEEISIDVQ